MSAYHLAQRDWAEQNWWKFIALNLLAEDDEIVQPACICGWLGHHHITREDALSEAVRHVETSHNAEN